LATYASGTSAANLRVNGVIFSRSASDCLTSPTIIKSVAAFCRVVK
jgi:hypothetical protein